MKSEYRRLAHTVPMETAALAIKIADATVCDLLRNEGGDGSWSDVETLDAIKDDLRYAEMRGFIERDPKKPTRFRFTLLGREQL